MEKFLKSRSGWSYEASDMNSDFQISIFHLSSDYKYKISGKN